MSFDLDAWLKAMTGSAERWPADMWPGEGGKPHAVGKPGPQPCNQIAGTLAAQLRRAFRGEPPTWLRAHRPAPDPAEPGRIQDEDARARLRLIETAARLAARTRSREAKPCGERETA